MLFYVWLDWLVFILGFIGIDLVYEFLSKFELNLKLGEVFVDDCV